MCNLGEVIARENLAKGRTEGITERAISDLKNLMETLGLSLEQAMSALKVPEAVIAFGLLIVSGKMS